MATVEFLIDEHGTWVDYAPHVVWSSVSFTAKVNGSVGDCSFQILDRARAFSFTFGQEMKLVIDGVVRWGGWMLRPQKTFAMSVVPRPWTQPRLWQIEGMDYNAIFDKRVIHDLSHPERTWLYDPGTYDDTIINDVWNYLDMDGFTKDIDRVAVAILDIPGVTSRSNSGNVASGGMTFREVMTQITRTTAAIFFCTPGKVVTYVDTDEVNSDYYLSDLDLGIPNSVPYREFKRREDVTSMVNDALVWGAGYGNENIVFSRHTDPDSPASYNIWQSGEFKEGVYRQATADAIAMSYVDGSPSAHRGAKWPKTSIDLVTYSTVFSVGDVVGVENSSFGTWDTLPIRQMAITFPTPFNPRFALTMTWEIDAAWSMFDPWKPYQPPAPGPGPCTTCPPPHHGGGGCSSAQCGITDTFNRADGDAGISDSGLSWDGGSISSGQLTTGVAQATLTSQFPFPFFCSFDLIANDQDINGVSLTCQGTSASSRIDIYWHTSGADINAEMWVNGEFQEGATGMVASPASEVDVNGTGIYVSIGGVVMSLSWTEVVGSSVTVIAVTSISFWGQDET